MAITTLADTNVLLRVADPQHTMHTTANRAVRNLAANGDTLQYLPQNIREFWNVCTRPLARNGLGFSLAQTESEVLRIEANFQLIPDGSDIYYEWRRMVVQHQVSGVQVHDCYIAAAMRVRGIDRLLTFNTADFARYGITLLNPVDVP